MRSDALLLLTLAACTGFDAGTSSLRRGPADDEPADEGIVSDDPPATTGEDAAKSASDASTDAPADVATVEDAPAGDARIVEAGEGGLDGNAFTGAPAYVATTGPSARKAGHNFAGNVPTTNPAGQSCFSCHGPGGTAPEFLFAGTVYKDVAGTQPAAQVEVRVRDATGAARSAYTDADGNFYLLKGLNPALVAPATTGARDATTTQLMTGAINNGSCNSCHRNGGQTPIHVP